MLFSIHQLTWYGRWLWARSRSPKIEKRRSTSKQNVMRKTTGLPTVWLMLIVKICIKLGCTHVYFKLWKRKLLLRLPLCKCSVTKLTDFVHLKLIDQTTVAGTPMNCLMQYEWPTYCISLINIHRAANRGEAFIAFWCLRCCCRADTVCRK